MLHEETWYLRKNCEPEDSHSFSIEGTPCYSISFDEPADFYWFGFSSQNSDILNNPCKPNCHIVVYLAPLRIPAFSCSTDTVFVESSPYYVSIANT